MKRPLLLLPLLSLAGCCRSVEGPPSLTEFQNEFHILPPVIRIGTIVAPVKDERIPVVRILDKETEHVLLVNPQRGGWLLLHLEVRLSANVKQNLLANRHVSEDNTYSSKLLSDYAHHGKSIGECKFVKTYLPKIRHALGRARRLSTSEDSVIDNLGTRVPILMDKVLRWL